MSEDIESLLYREGRVKNSTSLWLNQIISHSSTTCTCEWFERWFSKRLRVKGVSWGSVVPQFVKWNRMIDVLSKYYQKVFCRIIEYFVVVLFTVNIFNDSDYFVTFFLDSLDNSGNDCSFWQVCCQIFYDYDYGGIPKEMIMHQYHYVITFPLLEWNN